MIKAYFYSIFFLTNSWKNSDKNITKSEKLQNLFDLLQFIDLTHTHDQSAHQIKFVLCIGHVNYIDIPKICCLATLDEAAYKICNTKGEISNQIKKKASQCIAKAFRLQGIKKYVCYIVILCIPISTYIHTNVLFLY